jgi:hypothetical protein
MARKAPKRKRICDVQPKGNKCPKGYTLNKITKCCEPTLADVVRKGVSRSSPSKTESKIVGVQKERVLDRASHVKVTEKEEKELKKIVPLLIPIIAEDPKAVTKLVENANVVDDKVAEEKGWTNYIKRIVRKTLHGTKELFIQIGKKIVSMVSWLLSRPEVWFAISIAFLALKRYLCTRASSNPTMIYAAEALPVPWFQVIIGIGGTLLSGAALSSAVLGFVGPAAAVLVAPVLNAIISYILQLVASAVKAIVPHINRKTLSIFGILIVLLIALFEGCKGLPYTIKRVPAGTKGALTENQLEKFHKNLDEDLKLGVDNGYITPEAIERARQKAMIPISGKSKLQKTAQNEWTAHIRQPIQKSIDQKFLKKGWFDWL